MRNDYKKWAKEIAKLLNNEELNELTELLDNDANDEFFHQLNSLNAERNPEMYSGCYEK